MRDGLVEAALEVEHVRQRSRDRESQRVERLGATSLGDRLLEAGLGGEQLRVPLVGCGVAGILRDGLAESALGPIPVPVEEEADEAERGVRLGEPWVEIERAAGRGPRPRGRLQRRNAAEVGQDVVGVREPRVCRGVTRIGRDRLLEEVGRAPHLGGGGLVPAVTSAQVGLVGARVHRPRSAQAFPLARRELDLHLACDRLRQLALERQDVAHVALVALRPEMPVGGRLDELHGDAHAVAGAEHRPFHDRVHAQLARDLGQGSTHALVLHGGGARGHAQRPDPGEVGDQRLGHAVGEELLLRVAREVLEREHSERLDAPRFPAIFDACRSSLARRGRAPQVNGQVGRRLVAFRRILLEALEDDLLQPRRKLRAEAGRRRRRRIDDEVGEHERDAVLERETSRGHVVEHDAQRVEIGPRVDAPLHELLGRHVRKRADQPPRGRGHPRERSIQQPGDPEVEHLDLAASCHHDVSGLEVAVHDLLLVGGPERFRDLLTDRGDLGVGKRAEGELALEGLALDELHHQEILAALLADVEERGDRRMIEAGERACLAAVISACERADRQQLERDLALEPLVGRAIDDPHAAFADLLQDAEVGQGAAGLERALGPGGRPSQHARHSTTDRNRLRGAPARRAPGLCGRRRRARKIQ